MLLDRCAWSSDPGLLFSLWIMVPHQFGVQASITLVLCAEVRSSCCSSRQSHACRILGLGSKAWYMRSHSVSLKRRWRQASVSEARDSTSQPSVFGIALDVFRLQMRRASPCSRLLILGQLHTWCVTDVMWSVLVLWHQFQPKGRWHLFFPRHLAY